MTQDIKQQIEVMQHYAAGGEVESKYIAARDGLAAWKHNHNPEFDWVHFDYRIVGPSRAPFDPIQHMKNGGVCVDSKGYFWKLENDRLLRYVKDCGFVNRDDYFIEELFSGNLKPYQEPEQAVVWRDTDGYELRFENGEIFGKFKDQADYETQSEESCLEQLIEIAQGKWERVDD